MRVDEQANIASVLGGCRDRLVKARAQMVEQEPSRTLESIAARLLDVETALLMDVRRRDRRSPGTRLRQWSSPRLGILRHHPAEPLLVPDYYFGTDPPRPAPPISIVTPSLQQGRYLERTIYSVTSQHYPAVEYVVQDGGSSDETLDVLARNRHRLTRAVIEPDAGQADAVNRAFAITTGEIMAYLNSDDLLLPGSLAYVARYFASHPDVDVVYGHRVMIDEHDRQIGSWVLPPHDDGVLAVCDFVPQETLFWRRRIWDAAGGTIDTSFQFALDWELLLRFRQTGARMVRLPRFLGAFRVHDQQKTALDVDLCARESSRLRRRVHGREMSAEEIAARVKPYLLRHVAQHTLERAIRRVPLPRSHVVTHELVPHPPD